VTRSTDHWPVNPDIMPIMKQGELPQNQFNGAGGIAALIALCMYYKNTNGSYWPELLKDEIQGIKRQYLT
jgi:hypothetical protein